MKNYLIILTSILLLSLISCNKEPIDQKIEAEKLMELSRQWASDAQSNDDELILKYWANDAIVMSPGQPPYNGHNEIRKMVESSSNIPGFEIMWEPQSAFVSKSGDLGYVLAKNYIKVQDSLGNDIISYNKGVEIWKKQEDGSWKNVVDIFNSDPSITSIK